MTRFSYLRDRLFVISLAAYAVNKLLILPHFNRLSLLHLNWAWPFLHSHFDDLLLMPVALPVALWLQRLTGLRPHDSPPSWWEMFFHLAIWSFMCKIVGPVFFQIGVADPWDLLFYAVGGIAACLWWRRQTLWPSPNRT